MLDKLNTHKLGSLYEAFEPSESAAHRQTPGVSPHTQSRKLVESCPELAEGMAEIELSVFSRQCLNRRTADEVLRRQEVAALERERNDAGAVIDWRFSTQSLPSATTGGRPQ